MQTRSTLALALRIGLVVVLIAAAVATIIHAWNEAGGAPLNTILGTVLFMVAFGAGGLAIRSSSRGIWWGALAVLWVVLLRTTESAELLALPLLAMAAATEPIMYSLFAAVLVVALASAIGASGLGVSGAAILALGAAIAILAGLAYRRIAPRPGAAAAPAERR